MMAGIAMERLCLSTFMIPRGRLQTGSGDVYARFTSISISISISCQPSSHIRIPISERFQQPEASRSRVTLGCHS